MEDQFECLDSLSDNKFNVMEISSGTIYLVEKRPEHLSSYVSEISAYRKLDNVPGISHLRDVRYYEGSSYFFFEYPDQEEYSTLVTLEYAPGDPFLHLGLQQVVETMKDMQNLGVTDFDLRLQDVKVDDIGVVTLFDVGRKIKFTGPNMLPARFYEYLYKLVKDNFPDSAVMELLHFASPCNDVTLAQIAQHPYLD